jgi:PAS domain S-box-containing protein
MRPSRPCTPATVCRVTSTHALRIPFAGTPRGTRLGTTKSSGQIPQDRPELPAIAEALSDPIVGALDGTIHTWNAGAEQLFGYRADEVIGKPVTILYPPERLGELDEILRRLGGGEAITQFDTVRRRKDGTDVNVSLGISPVRAKSGEIVGVAIVHDISSRKRQEDFQRFLVEASRLLAVNLDYRETLSRVAHLTLSHLADWCLVDVPGPTADSLTQVAVAHRDPVKAELAREMRRLYPPDADRPDVALRVLGTGKAELIPEVSNALLQNIAQSPDHLRMLRELGPTSLIVVPLRVRERTLGTILIARTEADRQFNPEDLELAEDLARRAALAIDNSTLHRSEQEARHKAEQAVKRVSGLQAVTAALSRAVTPAAVAEVFVRQGAEAVGASGAFVRLLTRDGRKLKLAAMVGYPKPFADSYRSLRSTSVLPGAEVFRTDEERYFESAAAAEASSPEFAREHAATGHEAIAFVPLHGGGRPIGLMALSFAGPRTFDNDDRELLRMLASQCSQALERARLYDAELQGRSRLSRLVERLHEGVVSVDRRGLVDFTSSRAKQMLGAASLEEGRPVPEAWLDFPLRSFAASLFAAGSPVAEAQVASQDGKRVFDLTGIPAVRSEAALIVITDVSAREQRRRAEREFVDNAAHELRTPLAAITSAIERLQAGAHEVPEKRDRFLGHIQQESTRLNRLASSLLVLARAQMREEDPRREEIPLGDMLEELIGRLELQQGVELVFDCAPDLTARSNRDLLEHALLNLASNAVRHTDSGHIRVSAGAVEDGSVVIEVSDTGSGIAPGELSRLFDRFYRGPTEQRRSGFGLGLPIAKDAVEAVGGRIEIGSLPGRGTTARIVLPRP